MRRSLALAAIVIVSFAVGFFASRTAGAPHGQAADSTIDIPEAASRSWYPPVSEYESGGEPLEDERFDALMVMFEDAMTDGATLADIERSIEPVVQGFFRRIAIPELSEQQKEQATSYLQRLAERHPDQSGFLSRQVGMLGMYGGKYGAVPSFAQSVRSHVYADDWPADGGAFEDAQIERMLAALDAMLALPETVEDFEREAGYVFRDFTARLRRGQISDEQTARIFAHFDAFQAEHPELAEMMDERRHYIDYLIPGRVAQHTTSITRAQSATSTSGAVS